MGKKWWAILNDSNDILDYVEADTGEEAVRVYANRAHVPPEDAEWLQAIPGDGVRDDVEIPGWLISALEYGAEFAFGPRESSPRKWEDYESALSKLGARGIQPEDIVGWVRLDGVFDIWAPVVR